MPERRSHPSFPRMMGRALLRRCPFCAGRGAWFTGWFARADRCHTCGLRWERQPGFMTGSLGINFIVTFGLMSVLLAVFVIITYPDPPVGPLVAVLMVVAVVGPALLFPFCQTMWMAIDLAMRPLEPAERLDAAANASSVGDPRGGNIRSRKA